nr:phosphoserine transaminase [Bifidobacterium felsineum]
MLTTLFSVTTTVKIPDSIKPEDGRFGSGPSKVRPEQIAALDAGATTLLGTSHRQLPVKQLVGSIREGLHDFFKLPDGYEIALGNGGASAFWEIACASLITRRAAFGTYGSFSAKFAASAANAPFLEEPAIFSSEPGTYRLPELTEGVDTYCWAHNETSTGVAAPIHRVPGSQEAGALTVIDGTSAAGALPIDISQTDVYYFSPQKAFGSDGGLWVAVLSPAAIERAAGVESSAHLDGARRWVPPFLSLTKALENSRKDQTLNTPSVANLIMMENQVRWLNDNGGLDWATTRCAKSASLLYSWAERSDYAQPFVSDPAARSHAVVTIDLDERVQANQVLALLRENGIVDCAGYRKLGRNQLRVGVFPSVEPSDVVNLTKCIDYVVEHL